MSATEVAMAARGTSFRRWLSGVALLALVATLTAIGPRALAQPAEGFGRIGDLVWVDANLDGIQDADEPGMGGIAIELWSVTPLGELFEVVTSTTSDGLGRYALDAPPGNYRVRAALPDAETAFALTDVGDDVLDNDLFPEGDGSALSQVIVLASDQVVTDLDIGIHSIEGRSLVTVGSIAWHDVDRDGGEGVFDEPMVGLGVQVRDTADLVIAEAITNLDGIFEVDLAPGTYRFVYDVPDGFVPAPDSNLDENNATPLVTYRPGETVIGFGSSFVGPGANIFGEVFFDADGDGVNEAADGPAENIGVDLFRDGVLIGSTVTEADGRYSFLGLDPIGSYQVRMFGRPDLVWSNPALDTDGRSGEFTFDATGTRRIDGGLAVPPEEAVITFTSPRVLPDDTSALLRIDDVETVWDFSPVVFDTVVDQTSIVEVELFPAGAWSRPELVCSESVSAQLRISSTPPYSYWEVRAAATGSHECSIEADYFFDESVDVIISVVTPPEYDPVPVSLIWNPDVGGELLGKVALPGVPATFRVPAIAGGAEWFYFEDSPLEPVFSCDLAEAFGSNEFEFDPTGLGGMIVNCTIELVEPMPELATVTYTKVAPDLGTTFEVSGFGDLAPGTSVTEDLAIPIRISERMPDGFDLIEVVCTDGEWSETFTPRFPDSTYFFFTIGQATAGSTIDCTSTSIASTDDAEIVITRAGPPGITVIELDDSGRPTFELDETVTIRTETGRVELLIEPPAGQRFLRLTCGDLLVTRQPGTGVVSFSVPSGRTECTLTTETAANPPVEVHLSAVLPDDAADDVDGYFYDNGSDVFLDAEGAVVTHRKGTGDFDGVRFNTIATPPWEVTEVTCSGDVAVLLAGVGSGGTRFPRASVAFGLGVDAGDRVDCDVELQRLASVPLRIDLVGAPDDVDIPVRFDEVPVGDISTDAPLLLDVAVDREGYATFEADRVGYVTTSVDCDYPWARPPVSGPYGVLLLVTVEPFAIPDQIVCTVQVAPSSGGMLVVRTEVQGVEGNGSMRFDVEHGFSKPGDPLLATGVLSQRDARSFEVVVDRVRIRPTIPVTWDGVGVDCDGGTPEPLDDGSVLVFLARSTAVECVFTHQLVNPDDLGTSGDVNCDGLVDIIDALVIAQFDAGVRGGSGACPLVDARTELLEPSADFDASGGVDIIDALLIARCTVGLPAAPCPAAGEE